MAQVTQCFIKIVEKPKQRVYDGVVGRYILLSILNYSFSIPIDRLSQSSATNLSQMYCQLLISAALTFL